ncbi:hypothetical protein [Maribacter sp. ACAM166]|uniref:hypothetical protein n=1 Tax=Maribacter sp. ACAM166 TaxID=2508996 RepID=UPI0020177453|nr:hypothetical protein [Maribacter sp. ACAM166]
MKTHVKIAFTYFILAAGFGIVLRSIHSFEIPINYKFIVHTHSHIALLGWAYVALTTLIQTLFFQSDVQNKKYLKIFWFTEITLIGMLLTFPFQGYALFSIIFSTLFLFASYWFFWFFTKYIKQQFKQTNSYKCIKAALWFMVLSSIGPWTLGIIMSTLGAESIWYRLAIYFYLHFQYNGWMVLALFGLFLYLLEQYQIVLDKKTFKKFFWSINIGILLSFFLSTLFTHPPIILNILGAIGAILQLTAFGFLIKLTVRLIEKQKIFFSSLQIGMLKSIAFIFFIKMALQLLTALPYFANLSITYLDFTIGYLHWTFLGAITISLFFLLDYFRLLKISTKGYYIYVFGFVLTEILIFYKGVAGWQGFSLFENYYDTLAIGSALIPFSLIYMLVWNKKHSDYVPDC